MLLGVQADALEKLFEIIAVLRGDGGCPWDRAQRPDDILSDLIEEAYELQWAYAHRTGEDVLDEAGDVLFVLVFAIILLHEEHPGVTLQSLAAHAHEKIERRHPHVFGDAIALTREEGLGHWESVKAQEKRARDEADRDDLFADVPDNLPPMRRAEKIQKLAARSGFDWSDTAGIVAKIREELGEIEGALSGASRAETEDELGDLLFSVLNLSRFLNVDGERVLAAANAKFIRRYRAMEKLVQHDGRKLAELDIDEMESYWQRGKRLE
ncbi:MAG: nucleoside triphosphate pyrophosphohydrolase [Candidatus Krumholzibacteriia bacterium]